MLGWVWFGSIVGVILVVVTAYDLAQRKHAILRSFPVIGHLRYLLESVGPELRQYIVTDNRQERPFDRDQRRWIYTSAKGINNNFGFGSDADLDTTSGHIIIDQSMFPLPRPDPEEDTVACTKVLGSARHRPGMFRPASVVNVSAMGFGALSGVAVEATNRGCALAGCLHNTGEGGLTPHHLHGGELVFQIGTGYFGCRDRNGRFDLGRLADVCAQHPVRAIEIKLSQGAKPGLGGVLPAAKVTPEIAAARGIETRAGLPQPVPAQRVLRRRQPARLRRDHRRTHRPPCRHQIGGQQRHLLGQAGREHGRHGPGGGLHHRRRRGGAAPVTLPWPSATTFHRPSSWRSAAYTAPSPREGSATTLSSSARDGSACPKPLFSPWPSDAT